MSFLYKGSKTHDGNYWNALRTWILIKAMIYAKSIERHGFMAAITFCQPCLSSSKIYLATGKMFDNPCSTGSSLFLTKHRERENSLIAKKIEPRKDFFFFYIYKFHENKIYDSKIVNKIVNDFAHQEYHSWNNADFMYKSKIMDVSLENTAKARCIEASSPKERRRKKGRKRRRRKKE